MTWCGQGQHNPGGAAVVGEVRLPPLAAGPTLPQPISHLSVSAWKRWFQDQRGDGGGAALTWVILFPTVLLLLFGGIQYAYTGFAKSVALAAAEAGVRAATSAPADISRAAAAAGQFMADKGSDVENVQISVTNTADTVTVVVTGTATAIVPGMTIAVSQSASGPLDYGQ